jgi:hypothetical protein
MKDFLSAEKSKRSNSQVISIVMHREIGILKIITFPLIKNKANFVENKVFFKYISRKIKCIQMLSNIGITNK